MHPGGQTEMNMTLLKIIAWLIASATAIISTAFVIDERYAHAADVTHIQSSMMQAQKSIEQRVSKDTLENRKWFIEDRLQNIELKPEHQRTGYENAQAARYQRDLDDVNKRIRQLER